MSAMGRGPCGAGGDTAALTTPLAHGAKGEAPGCPIGGGWLTRAQAHAALRKILVCVDPTTRRKLQKEEGTADPWTAGV